jgi:hypothetical protein
VFGVNKFTDEALEAEDVFPIDPELQKVQTDRTIRGLSTPPLRTVSRTESSPRVTEIHPHDNLFP